jgi:tetratricopeptide (TPR) repeat protein
MKMRLGTFCWSALLLLGLSRWLGAATPAATAFDAANRLYEQGKYAEAATAYEAITAQAGVSAGLLFNQGNAWFRAGEQGRAIAAYRRAARLAPRDPDILANLQFARKTASEGTDPSLRLRPSWHHRLSLREWVLGFSVCWWLSFLLLGIGRVKPTWRKGLRPVLLIFALASLGTGFGVVRTQWEQAHHRYGVIIAKSGVARQGPLEEARSAFSLRDGLEVEILDQKEEWRQVRDSLQRTGWLKSSQCLPLGP